MWAIRDCRTLNSSEKSLLWAVESRGIHYGSWETVAADAGMKRDAYYRWRGNLEAKGALLVRPRPGRTTEHEVNAEWFTSETHLDKANDPTGDSTSTISKNANDLSGNLVREGDLKETPVRGSLKNYPTIRRIGGATYVRLMRPEEMTTPQKHCIGTMTPLQRSEWDHIIKAEAHLP